MFKFNDLGYVEVETNTFKVAKQKGINNLKKLIINEVKNYCKQLSNGYSEFCYQDTMNKILFVELNEDLSNLNLIF